MQYPVFTHVQKPSKLYGMNIEEAGVLMAVLLFFLVIGILVSSFYQLPWWYYFLVLLIVVSLAIIFRRSSKKNYPDYLLSYVSYYFMQAKVVEPQKIQLKSLSYYKELYQKIKEKEEYDTEKK